MQEKLPFSVSILSFFFLFIYLLTMLWVPLPSPQKRKAKKKNNHLGGKMESQATAQKSGKVQVILGADIFCNL